jgi:hypothetical protein
MPLEITPVLPGPKNFLWQAKNLFMPSGIDKDADLYAAVIPLSTAQP